MMVFSTLISLALLVLMRRPKRTGAEPPPDAAHAALD
jgi:hypothetical protein